MSLVDQLIEDLWAYWRLLSRWESQRAASELVAYLLANQQLVEDLLHITYEKHTPEERRALVSHDPALDQNGIPYEFYELARSALDNLSRDAMDEAAETNQQQLELLIRSLEFARNFKVTITQAALRRSPVSQFPLDEQREGHG